MLQEEWMTAHDSISEVALDSKLEKAAFERQLESDFRRIFTEELGVFLPEGYLE